MAFAPAEYACRIRYFRNRAEKVRTAAKDMHDGDSRRSMFLIAASYETMADHLESTEDLSLPIKHSPRLSP
jgi:hypothetical protein